MATTSVNTSALALLRDLGDELRRIRLEAGYRSQVDVARLLKCSQNKISYIERGKRWPDDALLKRLLKLYGVDDPKRADIFAMVRTGKTIERPWWTEPKYRDLLSHGQVFPLEDAAEKISTHSGTYVPGLLQTEKYVEALAAFGQRDESALRRELFVEMRLRRQQVLTRTHPLIMHALVLESALRPVVGGPDVMREQLRHLRTMAAKPNVSLRVIPFSAGAVASVGAPFTVFEFPGVHNKTVVMQDKSRGEELTDSASEVRVMKRKFAYLTEHALDSAETLQLIEEIEKEL